MHTLIHINIHALIRRSHVVNSICSSLELPFYPSFQLIFFRQTKTKNEQSSMKKKQQKKQLAVGVGKKEKNEGKKNLANFSVWVGWPEIIGCQG